MYVLLYISYSYQKNQMTKTGFVPQMEIKLFFYTSCAANFVRSEHF